MKKTILTILCSLFTICGMAQSEKTYTDQLVITINGKSEEPQTTTVTVIDNGNGTVNFEMKNFFMISGEDAIPVGNIFIENLLVSEGDDGLKHITYDAPLVIQPGDMEGVDMWYGPMFGEIPLKLNGKMTDEKFYAAIDIDLRDSFGQVLFVQFGTDDFSASLQYAETHVYENLSSGTYKNETLTTENVGEGSVTYESSNENVATVASDGTVTLLKNGSCIIKAKAGEIEATYTLTVVDDFAAGVSQIGNGDFEDWRGVSSSNHAPDNWNSFETAEGSFASFTKSQQIQMIEDNRPGSDGLYCADIWSRSVFGIVAQGNVTTGCINAGGISATDKKNYNYSKTSDAKKSETLSRVPTSIRFWAKFVPAAENAQHPNAHMEAVVHDSYDYITYSDPSYQSEEDKLHVIAKARKDFPTTNGEWTEFIVPFERTNNEANGQLYIIVNLATNADPGQGQADDHLYIDDVELFYEENDPIGIKAIENVQLTIDDAIYNLAGQRTDKMQRGINIFKGKKVLR